MSSLCTRFIFSNLVLAVPEMSIHSARVATSQPEGGRTVSLQSLCHYHSAMLTTYFTVGDSSLLDDPFNDYKRKSVQDFVAFFPIYLATREVEMVEVSKQHAIW